MDSSESLRIVYVGESWRGSSARSLREALEAFGGIEVDDILENQFTLSGGSRILRAANRLLRPLQQRELANEIALHVHHFRPHVLLVYKGTNVPQYLIREMKRRGVRTVNVYPDISPHLYGHRHAACVGEYDLVISTKPWHPSSWSAEYGYSNRCVFVPHGYDPAVHYWPHPPDQQVCDIVLVANYREEYGELMSRLGSLMPDRTISCSIAGWGWSSHAKQLPTHWRLVGPVSGRAYGVLLRGGRVVIAPVWTTPCVRSRQYAGDQDSTRSYELAAAGSFFLHRATPYIRTVYKEGSEVVLWDNVNELARQIRVLLPQSELRRSIAQAAHLRAVPEYSIPSRARLVVRHIRSLLSECVQQQRTETE